MATRKITRRRFVVRAAAGAAGLAVGPRALGQMMGGGGGGMGGGGMGGGGMGGGVIDPPVGAALVDPPVARNASTTPGIVDLSIEARVAPAIVNGASASLLTYNGSFIAPTIRAKRDDVVFLRFRNSLPATTETNLLGHVKNVTNVHVHGWHVSPGFDMEHDKLPADAVHISVPPGGEQVYCYDLRHQRPGSLGLYHPHVHGTVAEQMWGGLVGALDVADDPITALAAYEKRVLVLKDITISNGAPSPYTMLSEYMHGKEGSLAMVNAQVNPYLAIRPGEVKRLRIWNASNAHFYRLSLQGHALHVVGTDGGLLDKPYPVQELLLSPGERADVLVKAGPKESGDFKLLSLPYARMGSMASAQVTLATLRVGGSRTSQALPSAIDPSAERLSDDPSLPRPRFVLGMAMGRGYINGATFEILPDGTIQSDAHHSPVGDMTDEIWEVVNQSGMDHPWHQHVNDAQVLSVAGGDPAYAPYAQLYTTIPGFKDTILVPKWGSVTFRIPIRHFTGMTMYHCHILEHEDIGMMGMWHLGGEMPM